MKKYYLIISLAVSILALKSNAQIASGYEIANWQNFSTSAVSYTFDDNLPEQFSVAMPLLDKYGFKATFYLITDWTKYIAASANGHEIASHSIKHKNLNTLSIIDQDTELKESKALIRSKIKSADCVTFAYPYSLSGDQATVAKYYIAARNTWGSTMPTTSDDFYKIGATITGKTSSVQTATQFNDRANLAKSSKGWCVFVIHAIDNGTGYSPTKSIELESHLSYIYANKTDFWVATLENVVKYIKERKAVSIKETAVNTNSFELTVKDNLIDTIYNVPITIRRILPPSWASAKVFQNNRLINSTILTTGNNNSITFDAIPDRGDLIINKSDESNISN